MSIFKVLFQWVEPWLSKRFKHKDFAVSQITHEI